MSAPLLTVSGGPIPDDQMPLWCEMWADGDRRLRADEIAVNVFHRVPERTPGQLWERVAERLSLGERRE
ncbi:MAG: hypothetical protein K0S70_143 [Microbacterium sp.]|jgi:hypothetical protein|nr:hypothetical protein [Microbacterium sp.]